MVKVPTQRNHHIEEVCLVQFMKFHTQVFHELANSIHEEIYFSWSVSRSSAGFLEVGARLSSSSVTFLFKSLSRILQVALVVIYMINYFFMSITRALLCWFQNSWFKFDSS